VIRVVVIGTDDIGDGVELVTECLVLVLQFRNTVLEFFVGGLGHGVAPFRIDDFEVPSFGVVFGALRGDLVGPLVIADYVAHEALGLFLAAFDLVSGESPHVLTLRLGRGERKGPGYCFGGETSPGRLFLRRRRRALRRLRTEAFSLALWLACSRMGRSLNPGVRIWQMRFHRSSADSAGRSFRYRFSSIAPRVMWGSQGRPWRAGCGGSTATSSRPMACFSSGLFWKADPAAFLS